MFLDWLYPFKHLPELLSGALLTLELTIFVFLASFILGTLFSIVRYARKPLILYYIVTAIVEIFRNTPLLVQLFFVYFGSPQFGIYFSPIVCGLLVLTVNSASYYSEIMRGGIQSIPKGQWEAATSLGMSKPRAFLHIILPQSIRDAFPSITNQLVLVLFGTSVLSIMDVRELTQQASILNSQSFRSMELFAFIMILYYLISSLVLNVSRLAYKKWFASKVDRR